MKEKIKLRKAKLSDFDNLIGLNKDLFIYEKKFSKTYNENWPIENAGKEYFAKRLVNSNTISLVALKNSKVVGYIMGFVDTYSYRNINPIAEIENMFIEEQYRSKGIGSMLVDEFKKLAKAKDAKRIKVMLYTANENAMEFYKKHGFSEFASLLEQDI